MNLRQYWLEDIGYELSCYLTKDGVAKIKISTKGLDLSVGVSRNEIVDVREVGHTSPLHVRGSNLAAGLCDLIFKHHEQTAIVRSPHNLTPPKEPVSSAVDLVLWLASMSGGFPPQKVNIPKELLDYTAGWVLPV